MFRSEPTPRLVPSPVFILSATRSGSTLIRNILDTHTQVHATPELPLTELGVQYLRYPADYQMHTVFTDLAFGQYGLTVEELEYVLWDRILHHALVRSGKQVLVHKAPRVLLRWRRIAECWPEAKYMFLLRHPVNIMKSGNDAGDPRSWGAKADYYLRYLYLLREARAELQGLTIRYEDLTADPETVCRGICEYLGVGWEPNILDYGHRPIVPGSGDMSAKLRSGTLQPGRSMPSDDDIPLPFRPMCVEFGYAAYAGDPAQS